MEKGPAKARVALYDDPRSRHPHPAGQPFDLLVLACAETARLPPPHGVVHLENGDVGHLVGVTEGHSRHVQSAHQVNPSSNLGLLVDTCIERKEKDGPLTYNLVSRAPISRSVGRGSQNWVQD